MARIGEIKCHNRSCTCTDVAVHKTAGGRLSAKCHKCQSERWERLGTKGYRDFVNEMVMDEGEREPAPANDPAPSPTPAPPPAAGRKSSLLIG